MDQEEIIGRITPYVEAGVAVHWLKPQSKAPVDNAWSDASVASLADLRDSWRPGYNVGVRTGRFSKIGNLYLYLIDLDIRDEGKAAEARAALKSFIPEAGRFPMVASGSGGSSRHIYFLTDKPLRSKKLAHSEGFKMVHDPKKGRDVKKWDWEIELFGSGKQAVLPPSIHPDTLQPYRWVRPLDIEDIELGVGPFVPADRVFSWAPQRDDSEVEERPRLGMSADEVRNTLKYLPLNDWCEDRDGWLQVGMALHHEFGGSDEGFHIWCDFSKQSAKFDAKDQKAVWKSFRPKADSVRMATLVKAAKVEQLHDMFDEEDVEEEDEPEEDDEDLIGAGPEGEADASGESDDDLIGAGSTKPAAEIENMDWMQLLDLSDGDKPAIKPTLPNVELILTNDVRTRGLMRFNEFTCEVVYRGTPGKLKRSKRRAKPTKQLDGPIWSLRDPVNGDMWSGEKDNYLRAILETPKSQGGWGLKVSKENVKDAVDLVARRHAFHPVREYLSNLTWDGKPRVDSLFIRYLGAEDTAYSRGVSRVTLLGAVTRAFEPGHKFDFVAILEGDQGKRKSTFIETLAKSWFSELNGNFHDRKEMVERMQGSWIVELPELQGFTKSEVQDIKAFISAREDKVRLAYAPRAQVYQRQSIMMGSTNEERYLRDTTGGRRFWPVLCMVNSIDIDSLAKEVDQVWAEAVALYREMRNTKPYGNLPLYLSDEEASAEAKKMQEERRVETVGDTVAGLISAWLDKPLSAGFDDDEDAPKKYRQEVCGIEIWVECLGHDRRNYDSRAQQMLSQAMAIITKSGAWFSAGLKNTEKYGRQRSYWRSGHTGLL